MKTREAGKQERVGTTTASQRAALTLPLKHRFYAAVRPRGQPARVQVPPASLELSPLQRCGADTDKAGPG